MLSIIPMSNDMSSVLTFDWYIWFKIFVASAVLTALGFIGWNTCLHRLGAGGASIFLDVITITGVFGSVIYLGEILYLQHFIGFFMISSGIWISTRQPIPLTQKTNPVTNGEVSAGINQVDSG